ncbi:hypothetical protein [Rufibacter soli]
MKNKAVKTVSRTGEVLEAMKEEGYIHFEFADDDVFLKGKTFYMITAWNKTQVQIQRVPYEAKLQLLAIPEIIEHFRPIRRKEKIKSLLKHFNNPLP